VVRMIASDDMAGKIKTAWAGALRLADLNPENIRRTTYATPGPVGTMLCTRVLWENELPTADGRRYRAE
jgi:hypothetical protein